MEISENERAAVYKTIYNRRDTRREFKPDPIPDSVLQRTLDAAHHAPSVGFMQPWDFIIIQKEMIRQQIKDCFITANEEAIKKFDGERREKYKTFKLEGIMEAPMGICVTCDRTRTGKTVIGKTSNSDMDIYSTVCAIQNLWLAARAENIGVGWVSILHHESLLNILKIPSHITPIAYLCVGYVTRFQKKPDLEKAGWLPRTTLDSLVHFDQWRSEK